MEKEKYQIVIKVPMKCIDNVEARKASRELLSATGFDHMVKKGAATVKIQKINEDSAPEGIPFKLD